MVFWQTLTATEAGDLRTAALISLPAFATEAAGTIDEWSNWSAGERKACWRSAKAVWP